MMHVCSPPPNQHERVQSCLTIDRVRPGRFLESLNSSRSRGVCGLALPHLGHSGWEELGIASAVDRAKIMGSLVSRDVEDLGLNWG